LPAFPGQAGRSPAWLGFFESVARNRHASVLVIDSDAGARDLLAKRLENDDTAVVGFDDALEAMQWLELCETDEWPLAVFCEVDLEVSDGFAFLDALRTLESERAVARPIPVAALARHAMGDDRARTLEHGFVAHLAKPVSAEHLDRVLDRLLGAREAREARPEAAAADADAARASIPDIATAARRYRS